jgi:chaperonin GroES
MSFNLRPLGNQLVVEPIEEQSMTSFGIILPETAKEKPQKGTVLAIGEGRMLKDGTRAKPQVAKGDKVLFTSYAGTEIKVGSEEYMLMEESDILAILD